MILRIKFRKYGPIRFIGHLDVMRFFQKTIRRAEIDIAYSGGFSPHQIMSFAAPLGVGLESNGEYMDIEVHSITSCEDVKERLNKCSVPGIEIISVKALPKDAGNAMASVAAASYTVRFRKGREPEFMKNSMKEAFMTEAFMAETSVKEENGTLMDIKAELASFLGKEHILVTKETKKGIREIDLKPGIYEFSWDGSAFSLLLDASSSGNIKPAQVLGAFLEAHGECLKKNALFITREETFTDTECDGLASLDNIGLDDEALRDGGFERV